MLDQSFRDKLIGTWMNESEDAIGMLRFQSDGTYSMQVIPKKFLVTLGLLVVGDEIKGRWMINGSRITAYQRELSPPHSWTQFAIRIIFIITKPKVQWRIISIDDNRLLLGCGDTRDTYKRVF